MRVVREGYDDRLGHRHGAVRDDLGRVLLARSAAVPRVHHDPAVTQPRAWRLHVDALDVLPAQAAPGLAAAYAHAQLVGDQVVARARHGRRAGARSPRRPGTAHQAQSAGDPDCNARENQATVITAAAVMTVAWFSRALQSGSPADWAWCAVLAAVGIWHLLVVRDGRAPLLVADDLGVRVRRGQTWSGLRWQDVEHVDVQSPGSWLRDGRIVVHPREQAADLGEQDAPEIVADGAVPVQPQAIVVPLGRTTRIDYDGLTGDLVADLDALASGRAPVLVVTQIEPEAAETPVAAQPGESSESLDSEDAPAPKAEKSRWTSRRGRTALAQETAEDQSASLENAGPDVAPTYEPVEPGRPTTSAARSEVYRDSVRRLPDPPAIPAQRPAAGPVVVARVDDFVRPAGDPTREALIGPLVAAARNRARLSVDALGERTRIRPHVIESIEVDDFDACGGDFYARGHLRTLARVLRARRRARCSDLYDERYAHGRIDARQVFEAELATGIGGGVRGGALAGRTGACWSPGARPGRGLGRGPALQRHPAGAGQPGAQRRRLRPGSTSRGRSRAARPMTLAPLRGRGRRSRARRSSCATVTARHPVGAGSSPRGSASR